MSQQATLGKSAPNKPSQRLMVAGWRAGRATSPPAGKPPGLEFASHLSDDVESSRGRSLHEGGGQCRFDGIDRHRL